MAVAVVVHLEPVANSEFVAVEGVQHARVVEEIQIPRMKKNLSYQMQIVMYANALSQIVLK